MKWIGYLLSVILSILLIILIAINESWWLLVVPLYFGLFIYWIFRPTWNDRISAVKKIVIIGAIFTVILIIESFVLNNLANQAKSISSDIVPMFATPNILFIISLGAIFIAIPLLLSFLDGLTAPDQEGLVRNPLLVFVYVILTIGFYIIYWFWLIKKGLRNTKIEIKSLWWFLVPLVGAILLYIDFSKALEKRTQRKFVTWFLIFFFCQGIDVVINQALINHDILKTNSN